MSRISRKDCVPGNKPALIACFAMMLVLIGAAPLRADPFEKFHALRHTDYETLTGCKVSSFTYQLSLKAALGFLIFGEIDDGPVSSSAGYARRHTRPVFRDLYNNYATPEGLLAARCVHPTLRRIAIALEMLDAQGQYSDRLSRSGELVPANPALIRDAEVDDAAFPIMTRQRFVAETGCSIAPAAYSDFRLAFYWSVFDGGYRDDARTSMVSFLKRLLKSRPTADGFVDRRCMVPMVERIAADLDLLDAEGRHRVGE